jgi:predicted dehydrogenase
MPRRGGEVRVAVIGAGMAGRAHAYGYHLLSRDAGLTGARVRLVSVADENEEIAARVGAEFGFVRTARTWEEVASATDIDAVSVATPNDAHFEIVKALISRGKHVLCEKPLTRWTREAEELVANAEQAGIQHAVSFVNRFAPAVSAARLAIWSGRLGAPRIFHGRYWSDYALDERVAYSWRYGAAAGGGAIADLGSHVIDIARFVFGEIASVSGSTFATFVGKRRIAGDPVQQHADDASVRDFRSVENDDAAIFTVRFANGGIGDITVTRVAAGHKNALGFDAILSSGSASFNFEHASEFHLFEENDHAIDRGFRRVVVSQEHPYFGLHLPMPVAGAGYGLADCFGFQARAFVDSIIGERDPTLASFQDGLRAVAVCRAVEDSEGMGGASVRVQDQNNEE